MARKLQWYLKPSDKGGVNSLLLPESVDAEGNVTWKTITDKDEIFRLLAERNTKKLSTSNKPPFATGPLADAIGPYGDNEIVDKILDGTVTHENLGLSPQDVDDELDALLTSLQYATTTPGTKITEMSNDISLEEYKTLFTKTGEMTASSQSKTHMGHYKASCERDNIALVHLSIMQVPFKYGFSLNRWQHSLHCMLLKKELPYIDKLRIIQLIEADFNAAMKILLSRRLMRHADHAGANSNQTHGGRQGRSTYDAMIISQLSTDITRLNRSNLLVKFNDADGCYDRMRPELCSIVLRRDGCPKSVASCHSKTITHMKHKILTAHGESIITIINTLLLKLGGTGQGSAGSGPSWHCHMEPLIDALIKFSPGFQFTDITNTIKFIQYIIGYIDDNTIMCNLPNNTFTQVLLQTATSVLQSWQRLLRHTGGDLSLPKCLFTLITWVPTKNGELRMATVDETPGNINIQTSPTTTKTIRRVEPDHAERILGVRMAATVQMKTEHIYRLEQARVLAARIKKPPLHGSKLKLLIATGYPLLHIAYLLLHSQQKKMKN